MGRGRPKKKTVPVRTRMDEERAERLANRLIEGGFVYERDGVKLPEWGQWLEALEARGVMISKNPSGDR